MEDEIYKTDKKNKTGPLKSTPGFLKCMRNVYLYFKEEKEKGALNIPINSFIERTAVACGVGRKTLYNYAKKGLFDEHPTILQPKQKKKKSKKKLKTQEDVTKKTKKKISSSSQTETGPSSSLTGKKKAPRCHKTKRTVFKQTELRPILPNDSLALQTNNFNVPDGFTNFMLARDQNKVQQTQVMPNKVRETTHVLTGPWATGPTSVRRDAEYFSKNNLWHAVYNLHAADSQHCTPEVNTIRLGTCQQQTTGDHLSDL